MDALGPGHHRSPGEAEEGLTEEETFELSLKAGVSDVQMGDTASLYYCGARPLGNKAVLGENYFLLLAPLAYISSVKKNGVTQPSQTQPLPGPPLSIHGPGEKVGDDAFIVFSVLPRDAGRTQGPAL